MAPLRQLLKRHLEARNLTVKTLAERMGISYPTLLALVNKGSIPRSQEHRDAIRKELNINGEQWAAVLAGSMRDGIEIPTEGPLTLQQLITREMLSKGYTEQSLSEKSGIPYPTLLGITRKGSIPRGDTLPKLAEHLDLDESDLDRAVVLSRQKRAEEPDGDDEAEPTDAEDRLHLAQLALDAVTRSGVSMAAFGRSHGIPYLSLVRLISKGMPPVRSAVLIPMQKALDLDTAAFEVALDRSKAHPTPANRARSQDIASNPIQASLLKLVQDRALTIKAFADLASLSVLTATRLLRKGDLPGRQATHAKLRSLMGLSSAEYDLLLQRAKAAGARQSDDDDDDALPTSAMPSITETYTRQGGKSSANGEAPAGTFTEAFAAKVSGEPSDDDFMIIIRRLGPKQRRALMGFLTTLAG